MSSSKKVTVNLNGGFRQFEVVGTAKTINLVFLGEYNEGFGGLAYLDVTTGKAVLVPNVVQVIQKAEPLNLSSGGTYGVVNGKWTQQPEAQQEAQEAEGEADELEAQQPEAQQGELGATNF